MNSRPSTLSVASERRYLYLYAMVRLRDPDLAEDAVQETMVAALEALPRFEGRSSLRTWLVTILRHKIADLLQQRGREATVGDDGDDYQTPDEKLEALFQKNGQWQEATRPRAWNHPEAALEQREFWQIFESCLRVMPARIAEVFMLREILGEAIDAICKSLAITETNCSVMLYRARMRLRGCLEHNWFGGTR